MKKFNVAVVGASGAVGREVLATLAQRSFPFSTLRLFSSHRSAGQKTKVGSLAATFEVLGDNESFKGLDIVFFTSGSTVSEQHAFRAAASGALVIDNASIFRMRPDVPLVVPEVNGAALDSARDTRVVANPNCTTAQMVMALKPLHDRFRVKRVVLASYQAVSGKGQKGIDEFKRQIREHVDGRPLTTEAFPHPIAFNCLPHIDTFRADGFTGEEHKVMEETRKILGDPSIRVVATCVRVPVLNCHSESVTIETEKPVTVEQAREALSAMPGVKVFDDPATNTYPLALDVSGKDDVYVGRIRKDPSLAEGQYGLTFWVVGDNLRKGAALNAVQIAEAAIARGLIQNQAPR
ncbi:MAG: aspartate-semialdehyde dehydrogenase [Deltaproteobacteria bacterium]|nr:aspartate-semialdehyde dehydrogenase [Deltaproteobacteria bacterium]